jgi:uncharacterized protein (DUF1501 family)
MTNRREFLKLTGVAGLVASPVTRLAFANIAGDARFVLVILRGGMDGLAAVPPYGDYHYERQRGTLALPPPGAENGILDLNGYFGLHPAFKNLYTMFNNNEALVFHGLASPYRDRSHFDGQKLLENGTNHPLGADDGWLNRTIGTIPAQQKNTAIAMAQKVPLVLYGDQSVNSWSPAVLPEMGGDTIHRIMRMYQQDDFLFEQLETAIETREMADDLSMGNGRGQRRGPGQMQAYVNAAGKFLVDPEGPRIAVLEISGWDTHANQGNSNGQLANQFNALDDGLLTLKNSLGSHWNNTVITIVTEFGRTVAVNGTNGTDHGTASVALLAGGAVNGGKLFTDWPGLAKNDLYEGRDLNPTMDMRSMFKSVLHDHLQVSQAALEKTIFPGSATAKLLPDLIRT